MSDLSGESTTTTPTQEPAPVVPPEPVGAPAGAPPASEPDPLEMPDGTQLFQRDYVEKIRAEAAKYRTRARELEEAQLAKPATDDRYSVFDQYEDDDRAVWTDLAGAWLNDPYEAAKQMQTIAQRVLSTLEEGTATPEGNAEMDRLFEGEEQITVEKVQQIVQAETMRQQRVAEMEQMIAGVYDEIRKAGIEPNSIEGHNVLWRASNETGGDIAKALEAHRQHEQQIIDRFIASKAPQAPSGPPPVEGTAGVHRQEPETLDDAFKSAREFLASRNAMS